MQAIKRRFESTLHSKEALLAAVTIPKFKLRWVRDEAKKDSAKCMLAAECRALRHPLPEELPPAPVSGGDDDFFSFTEDQQASVGGQSLDTEIADYLKSGVEIDTLQKFPLIKTLFLRYNNPTPSSAPVERLFSLGSLVLTPKRNRLSDKRFERLLLLRFNHYFEKEQAKCN